MKELANPITNEGNRLEQERQGGVNDIAENEIFKLDKRIELGLGIEEMDIDSVKQQIVRLPKRYIDLKTMQQTLVDLIKNPNVSKLIKKFYMAD
jgi:hypothetical protein